MASMHNRPHYYKLIGRLPVPLRDIYRYDKHGNIVGITTDPDTQKEYNDAWKNRRIARTEVGPMLVSTVFLVVDHNWSPDLNDPPILFETMIRNIDDDDYQERYSTWDEAEKGHARAIEHARGLLAKAIPLLEPSDK